MRFRRPIRTLAASGIKDFRSMLNYNASRTPLRRNTTIEEVGNTAAFLSSDLAAGIRQTIYVDNGFNITAMADRITSNAKNPSTHAFSDNYIGHRDENAWAVDPGDASPVIGPRIVSAFPNWYC